MRLNWKISLVILNFLVALFRFINGKFYWITRLFTAISILMLFGLLVARFKQRRIWFPFWFSFWRWADGWLIVVVSSKSWQIIIISCPHCPPRLYSFSSIDIGYKCTPFHLLLLFDLFVIQMNFHIFISSIFAQFLKDIPRIRTSCRPSFINWRLECASTRISLLFELR